MTKEQLKDMRRERGKQELNIGDKVIVHSASDKPLYDGKIATIIEKGIIGNEVYFGLYIEGVIVEKRSKPLIGAAGIIGTTSLLAPFYAEDLELVKEQTPKEPNKALNTTQQIRTKADAMKYAFDLVAERNPKTGAVTLNVKDAICVYSTFIENIELPDCFTDNIKTKIVWNKQEK